MTTQESRFEIYEKFSTGTIKDFLLPVVEFLGILVPGLVFILLLLPAIFVPCFALINTISESTQLNSLGSEWLVNIAQQPNFIHMSGVFVFAYVVGHLFFRQDPKYPDRKSFNRVKQTIGETGPVRLCDKEREYNRSKELPSDEYNLEFPYRYLFEYLTDRGMIHLADLVPWRGLNPETYPYRSKHFINSIKIRLEFLFPIQYTRIQRNEAHVRLMSSMWYATKALISISIIGLLLSLLIFVLTHYNLTTGTASYIIHSIFAPFATLIVAILIKNYIESFLHYQRIREIIYILETAYFANIVYSDMDILAPIITEKVSHN